MDSREVDDILPSYTPKRMWGIDGEHGKPLFYARESEWHHESGAIEVIHMGVMVISHEIKCLGEIYHVELIMHVKAQP